MLRFKFKISNCILMKISQKYCNKNNNIRIIIQIFYDDIISSFNCRINVLFRLFPVLMYSLRAFFILKLFQRWILWRKLCKMVP